MAVLRLGPDSCGTYEIESWSVNCPGGAVPRYLQLRSEGDNCTGGQAGRCAGNSCHQKYCPCGYVLNVAAMLVVPRPGLRS
jgi:hypothetical protein